MHGLPSDWVSLCLLAGLLGMRHGLDADHLATIDGMTRLVRREGGGFADWCGTLFSLGHGAVVIAVACGVGWLGAHWEPPAWLEIAGGAISIGFLVALGVLNLRAVMRAPSGQVVQLVGVRGRWVDRFVRARSPWRVAGVGGLFAISFDTLSQATLFGAAGGQFGGGMRIAGLSGAFVAGMLLTDGLNGWWIARLVRRSDRLAVRASRVLGTVIACVSLAVAGIGVGRWMSPVLEQWLDASGLGMGLGVMAVVFLGYVIAILVARTGGRGGSRTDT